MLSVALGQVVLLTIHMTQLLGISLKHPLIYNSHRSSIVQHDKQETKCLPLYINARTDYKTLDTAIKMLTKNLKNILSMLERIKEREGIGRIDPSFQDKSPEPSFPNFLLLILYRIAEFQVY
jgi:hypothetical protein